MPELYEATTLNPDHVMEDHSYGKGGVKILCVAKNGAVHSIKELEVSTRLMLNTQKDYLEGDNSDIVATDSQKNTVYVLAKKHGVKSCEEFAILLSKHFISTYSHVTKAVVSIEEVMWDRVSYDDKASHQRQHNHAFIHTPVCTRFATVSLNREDKHPDVVSGIKNMRVLKTTQSSFVNFVDDAYRTLPDAKDRIFSTIVDCSWAYKKNPSIDYDKAWEHVKYCILYNFAGDLDYGVYSPSVQNTLYLAEKQVLEEIADVNSIEMTLPNKHYVNIDFSKFKKLVNTDQEETVFLPLDKPSGVIYLKLGRKMNKL